MDRLTRDPIDVENLCRRVESPACGAVAIFIGRVRKENRGRMVLSIDYSAYEPMAERVIREIEADLQGRFSGVRMVLVQRVGRLQVGEASVAVIAAAPHRREALQACAEGIEALKFRVPVWKKEYYRDGSAWIEGDRCAASPSLDFA
jgi:molybdopterin synthase catalytic subunit